MNTRERWILAAVVLGSAIVFLDATVVNVALPAIGRDLPSSLFGRLEAQSYVYTGYLLSLSALLILAGALNDYYGRRRMFAIGLSGFGLTSILCGLAPNMEFLIVARIAQGATGALLVPGSLSLITANFEGEQRGRVFGIWAGASAATSILGPFVGGLLVQSISWRAAFFINVPLLAIAIYATVRHVPESRDEQASSSFDWLGALVVALAVGGLSFGAIRGQEQQWQDPLAFWALGVGVVATIAFPFLMRVSRNPLVPLELFKSRNFSVTNLSTLVIYGALYVNGYFVGLYIQGTVGYSAAAAGIAGIPASILLALFSSRFGGLAGRYGSRWFMTIGPLIMGIGILWLLRFPIDSKPWALDLSRPETLLPPSSYIVDVFPAWLIFGLGLTMMVAPLTTALMASVPSRNSGLASAINNAVSRVGPQLAGAAIYVAITASFYPDIARLVPGTDASSAELRHLIAPLNPPAPGTPEAIAAAARQASTDAFHLAMAVSAALLFAGAIVNWIGIRDPKRGSEEQHGRAPEPERNEAADPAS
jgi:EmrB/QacA subfamily drug resistance transporter